MDLKKYDKLRKKISAKDFEGRNKGLDKWLFAFSFIGNVSAIFFAYFLVYPSLEKAISLNFMTGFWGSAIAFLLTVLFLSIFEIAKRYFIRNFSNDYFNNRKKLNAQSSSWFILSIVIIALSFYLSITGSKNLATTSFHKNNLAETEVTVQIDSLTLLYEDKIKVYEQDNDDLRKINNDLRKKQIETPLNYRVVRNDYQLSIDKNEEIIKNNENYIKEIKNILEKRAIELKEKLEIEKSDNQTEDTKNIFLFIIIVIVNEVLIIGGIYFREYYEHKLYDLNQQKYEKIYLKKDRYLSLLSFVYSDGKLSIGDRVISGSELKDILSEKTNIPNSNKLVEEFLHDMDRLGIFVINGKRRHISIPYHEAIEIVENFDDMYRVIENMK